MKENRKKIIIAVLLLMVLALSGIAAYYGYNSAHFVSTDDAKVTGDLARVYTQISGKLLDLKVDEGQSVVKDQILGRQDLGSLSDSYLEASLLRAPISGMVIKKQGTVGEALAAGQLVSLVVDPQKLYVSANIEETDLGKVKEGQKVDVEIDLHGGKKIQGKVKSIGEATAATFSVLPSTTGGNYTKVIQKVPVKIELEKTDLKILPGLNAEVRIHVK